MRWFSLSMLALMVLSGCASAPTAENGGLHTDAARPEGTTTHDAAAHSGHHAEHRVPIVLHGALGTDVKACAGSCTEVGTGFSYADLSFPLDNLTAFSLTLNVTWHPSDAGALRLHAEVAPWGNHGQVGLSVEGSGTAGIGGIHLSSHEVLWGTANHLAIHIRAEPLDPAGAVTLTVGQPFDIDGLVSYWAT